MVEGKPVVDYDKCTGCGACVTACPRNLIARIPFKKDQMLVVACMNKEPTKLVRQVCKVGCIGCKLCQRLAPDVFTVEDNVANIDYEKYTGDEDISKVLEKCPAEVLMYFGKPKPEYEQVLEADKEMATP